ncbi:MAG: hypothetical protein PHV82_14730, partial [Victivallaceae bacterium]|nr:hypothetical protein [Victivallaceae bacterium]
MKQAFVISDHSRFHFFGYYDKFQDNASGRLLLALETDFMDRMPTSKDTAGICLIDAATGKTERIAETSSWCWQQGCMLQWLPSAAEDTIIFNTRLEDQFVSCIMNINSGRKKFFSRPIYTVSNDGSFALSLNFSRLAECRPGYGYEGIPDPWRNIPSPEDDGIYHLDLETDQSSLIISLAELAGKGKSMNYPNQRHWFNHLLVSPNRKRFVFLHRWSVPGGRMHQFYSSDIAGNRIFLLNDNMTSHFNWKDPSELVAWANFDTDEKDHYYLIKDNTGNRKIIG